MQKTLTKTNIQYKIFTGLKDFNLPTDVDVTIEIEDTGKKYIGHTHKTQQGRIDRLSKLFNDMKFNEGDTCTFTLERPGYIKLSMAMNKALKELLNDLEKEEKATFDFGTGNEINTEDDDEIDLTDFLKEFEVKSQPVSNALGNIPEIKPEITILKNVPKMKRFNCNLFMPNDSNNDVWACGNKDLIVIFVTAREQFIIFDKKKETFKRIPIRQLHFDKKVDLGNTIWLNGITITPSETRRNDVYFSTDNVIYKWDITSGTVTKKFAVNKKRIMSGIVWNDNTVYYAAAAPSGKTMVVGTIDGGETKFNKYYGVICGSGILSWLSDIERETRGILFKTAGKFFVYDVPSFRMIDAKECVDNYMHPDQEAMRFRNFIYGFKDKYDTAYFGNEKPYYCSNYFCDDMGNCVYVSDRNYDFMIRTNKGNISLSKTYGACVPEDFLMIDSVTALVRIDESILYGMYDFEKGKAYKIKL